MQICYEIVFSGEVVDRGNRPDYIFNPSNDGWFGAWGPPQHLAQARLRAIEEGLPVLRSTTTGISAVIDADGVVRRSLPRADGGRDRRRWSRRPARRLCSLGSATGMAWRWAALLLVASRLRSRRRARLERQQHKAFFISAAPAKDTDRMRSSYLFTSESVSEGHPDKVSDQISRRDRRPVPVEGPRGARRLRDADHHPAGRAGRRNPLQGRLRERRNWAPGAREEIEQTVRDTVKRHRLRAGRLPLADARLRQPPARPVGAYRAGRRRQRQQGRRRRRPGHHVRLSPATRRPT